MGALFRRRRLRALQVEVTSRCTRTCMVCPRSVLSAAWREGDLSREHWGAIRADLGQIQHVHLQGWGEPLLHPALPEWAGEARRAGCTVGLTTNGDLLDVATPWLLEGDIGLVALSVAGDTATHASLRDDSDLPEIMAKAGELAARAREKRKAIRLQVSFLLTRTNAADLPGVVERSARAGIDEVFVIHLDCRPSRDHAGLSAFSGPGLLEEVMHPLREAESRARRMKIRYRGPPTETSDLLVCALDPTRFAYVGHDGKVGPCVNLMLPVNGPIPRWNNASETLVAPVHYGQLEDSGLGDILDSRQRELFTAPFLRRMEAERLFMASVLAQSGAEALARLDAAAEERESALSESPCPPACSGCPKSLGW